MPVHRPAPVAMYLPPVPPVPIIAPVIKTSSKMSMGKATKLKSSSRDDLQIPAFGFIDVCFCVDATGSMSS